jgi:hypothetical protein
LLLFDCHLRRAVADLRIFSLVDREHGAETSVPPVARVVVVPDWVEEIAFCWVRVFHSTI